MYDISLPENRHPVDALADVREVIKTLQDREADLKSEVSKLMGGADSLGGDEFIARQTLSERAGAIDAEAMKKAGINVDAYRKPPTAVVTLRCERRVQEAA